jgi:hypothetical protein
MVQITSNQNQNNDKWIDYVVACDIVAELINCKGLGENRKDKIFLLWKNSSISVNTGPNNTRSTPNER